MIDLLFSTCVEWCLVLFFFLHRPGVDVWKVTAKFANILKDVDVSHVKLYEDKREGRTANTVQCLIAYFY